MLARFLLLLFCLAAVPGPALAQDGGPALSDEHEASIASNPDAAVAAFTRLLMDLSPRGLQTRAGLDYAIEEGKARRSARRAGEILALDLDRDGDGALSAAEIADEADRENARHWTAYEAVLLMDVDGDGTITAEDIPNFVRVRAANPRPPVGCAYSAPSAEAEIALVGDYHGAAVPSVTVPGSWTRPRAHACRSRRATGRRHRGKRLERRGRIEPDLPHDRRHRDRGRPLG
jgi:hypothetical protein